MKITVLGKYGPTPKVGGATSSYFLETKGKKILIDLGAGAFSRLLNYAKPEELDFIILSHFHFDHTSDIGVLIYYLQGLFSKGYNKKLKIFCPFDVGGMSDVVNNCPYFDVMTLKGEEKMIESGLEIEFFNMRHPVPCIGVKIFDGEKIFAYTGDTNTVRALDDLFSKSDLVLADGAFLNIDWNENLPHLSIKHIIDLTIKWGNRSIITHINPKYTQDEIEKEIKGYGDICQIAQEGKSYEI